VSPTSDPARDDLLVVADGCLLLSHRLTEWIAKAPSMEEDVAIGNVALDLLGQARGLYSVIGDEDRLAYFRNAADFRNPLVCELPNGDFGHTMLRLLFVATWLDETWRQLTSYDDETVRGVAGKAMKETAYHVRHAAGWVVRLGDGTDESHARMTAAVEQLWPYRGEIATDHWYTRINATLDEATLHAPDVAAWSQHGGTTGRHTEHLDYLLAEMQSLARAHPGASW
jgi:ring-1,2-phenylacetyl-CoA epoxidase subunit PaaC